jgi:hypothetical protein
LIVNGDKEIKLADRTITYQDLSNMLLEYCFVAKGLGLGGASFIQCFPMSYINTIKGYTDQLYKLLTPNITRTTALLIFDQYVANHPEDYHFVQRLNSKAVKPILESAGVIPTNITVEHLADYSAFWRPTYQNGTMVPAPYPYISFKDSANRRYLYKGDFTDSGIIKYSRMQVLGNAENGFLEEYEQGKPVMFGDVNSVESVLNSNGNVVLTTEIQNALDAKKQEASERGEVLTQEDYRETIETLIGSGVQTDIVMDSYETKKEDLTGIEFCITL